MAARSIFQRRSPRFNSGSRYGWTEVPTVEPESLLFDRNRDSAFFLRVLRRLTGRQIALGGHDFCCTGAASQEKASACACGTGFCAHAEPHTHACDVCLHSCAQAGKKQEEADDTAVALVEKAEILCQR